MANNLKRIGLLFFVLMAALMIVGCSDRNTTDQSDSYNSSLQNSDCNISTEELPIISDTVKEYLVEVAGQGLLGEKYEGRDVILDFPNRIHLTYRQDGEIVYETLVSGSRLDNAIYEASVKASNYNEIQLSSKPLNVEIEILGSDEEYRSANQYERGLSGIKLVSDVGCSIVTPKETVEKNLPFEKAAGLACRRLIGGDGSDCSEVPGINIYLFDSEVFIESEYEEGVTTLYRGNKFVDENITVDDINRSFLMAKDWIINNINDEGYFTYLYYPSSGVYPEDKNNMIRQFMASRLLAEFSQEDESLIPKHRKNLDYILANWYNESEGMGYVYFRDGSKLGATGMLLRVIAASPLYEEYKEYAHKLYLSIESLQEEDGELHAWIVAPDRDYDEDYLLTFYSGESILGVIELYERDSKDEYLQTAILSQNFYIGRYIGEIDKYYYPAYVPWHTQSLYKIYQVTKNHTYAESIFFLNDEVLKIQNLNGVPYKDYEGRFYDPVHPEFGTPHSSSDGVYAEGLAYAYGLAKELNYTGREQFYLDRFMLASKNLIRLQFNGVNMYYLSRPENSEGAIRSSVSNNVIRTDTTQHITDGYLVFLRFYYENA